MSKRDKRSGSDDALSIGEIISREPSLKKVQELLLNGEVIEKFYEIFPGLRGIATPAKMEKKVLYITVDYSVLKGELKFHDAEIVEKINSFFNEERIKKIRFSS